MLEAMLAQPDRLTGNLGKLRVVRELAERIEAADRPLEVLDVGCVGPTPLNQWWWLLPAYAGRIRLTGIDVRGIPEARRVAAERGLELELREADGYAYAAELGRTFDAVVSTQVLEHVRRPLPFLQEMRKVLLPGGLAWLTFDSGHVAHHHGGGVADVVRDALRPVLPERYHDRGITAEQMHELARDSGFAVDALFYCNLPGLKHIDNHEVSPAYRAAFLRSWMALEETLNADHAFLAKHRDRFAGIGVRLRAV